MKHAVRFVLLSVGCATLMLGMSGCSSDLSSQPPAAASISATTSQPTGKQEISATAPGDAATFLTQTPPVVAAAATLSSAPAQTSTAATPAQVEQGKLPPGTVDACALITREEVQVILGETTGEGKLLDNSSPGETNSICDYSSQQEISSGSGSGAVSISLRQLQTLKKAQNAFDFTTTSSPGETVPDIGDQAFWNTQTKRLFVRKGSAFFYIYVLGPPSELDAAKSVAQKASGRLP